MGKYVITNPHSTYPKKSFDGRRPIIATAPHVTMFINNLQFVSSVAGNPLCQVAILSSTTTIPRTPPTPIRTTPAATRAESAAWYTKWT
jgi:hypothetical protein